MQLFQKTRSASAYPGVWTFDSITPWEGDEIDGRSKNARHTHFARLLKYNDNWKYFLNDNQSSLDEKQTSIRYMHLNEGVANEFVREGYTFTIDWRALSRVQSNIRKEPGFVATPDMFDGFVRPFSRNQRIEEELEVEIASCFEQADPLVFTRQSILRQKAVPELCVFNVGQGDTILLKLPNGESWLFDATGTNSHYNSLRQSMNHLGVNQIDKLIITHFHYDHIRRAIHVIRDFNVRQVVVPFHFHKTKSAAELLTFSRRNSSLICLKKKMTFTINYGTKRNRSFKVFLIPTNQSNDPLPDCGGANENAIIARIESNDKRAILAADVPASLLVHSIGNLPDINESFYKVTHHCSETGNDQTLMDIISPSISATSCGRYNRYHHPHLPTKSLIDNSTRYAHRLTYLDGDIHFQF